jgi:hypothetical protein
VVHHHKPLSLRVSLLLQVLASLREIKKEREKEKLRRRRNA